MDRLQAVQEELRAFADERDWHQFHTPDNLAKSIAIEAAELLECYQWGEPRDASAAKLELADVLTYAFLLARILGEDPIDLVGDKLEITRRKYPVELARGRSTKYDKLDG